jgi:hypothetical protein
MFVSFGPDKEGSLGPIAIALDGKSIFSSESKT